MTTVQLKQLNIRGINIRTSYTNEMDQNKSKINSLWNEFFTEDLVNTIKNKKENSYIYGVYSNYENEEKGYFTVTAGVEVCDDNTQNLSINEGKYLIFKGSGKMPDMVIETWRYIYNFFELNKDVKRKFTTDFEKYLGQESIEIYIAVE